MPRDPIEDDIGALANSVASLYAEVMETTPDGVTVAVRELGPRRVLRDGRPVVAIRCDICARAGVEERKIANATRHKNLPVLRAYIRAASAVDDVGEVL